MAINKEYNDVQLDVKFTEASTRANLVSEENISVSFGKLAKWHEALVPSGGSSGQFLGWNSDGTAKWVSNPNSDTKVTDTVGTANTYYPAGLTGTSTATGTQVFDTSFKFIGTTGTTSAVGKAQLVLGNSTASGTANNKQGSLVVYGSTAYAHTIQGAPTAARTLTLPDKTGTFALTSDIPTIPPIPTVNDAALTLKGAGTTVTTFTANASSPKSLDIVAGSNVTVTADATNSKILIASSHPTITKSTDTTSTASPGHGGTFTTVDTVTRDAYGHVTKINTKTITLPADSNTDTKVTQSATTTANYRPILFGAKNSTDTSVLADTVTDAAYASTLLYARPQDGTLYANKIFLHSGGSFGQINMKTNSYNVMLRQDNSNTYFLVTAKDDPDGTWTSARPLTINNSTGVCSINGNAATASAWATARTLSLSGQLTGSVSVKGNADMTLNGYLKNSFIYDETEDFASYAWHKFAETTISNPNNDYSITFIVSKTWGNVPRCSGILTAHIRTNSTKIHDSSHFYWQLANADIDPEDFVFVYTNTANTSCKVELWHKQSSRWDGWIFSVLKEHSRLSKNNAWTLYTDTGHGSASHTTGTASYASSIADIQNNTSGTSSNVTGTVAIAHGGTGATTRLNALKALTDENVGTNAQYFLTITNSWGKGGYTSVANAKTVLGLGSAAYTESSDYVPNTQTGVNNAINLLSTGGSTPGLADYYVSQYANGGTTTTSYHRRPISAMWNAFKGLITLATTGSGNAVTGVSIANDGDHNRKITVTKGSTFSLSSHTHGLLHSDLDQASTNGTTGGWSVIGIDPAVAGYVLKSIRVNTTSPDWLSGDYGAGIAFGGSDTKGVISMKYNSPVITFAGGNHNSSNTSPDWYLKISGTSGNIYNFDNYMGAVKIGSYYGMAWPDGTDKGNNSWIRTTRLGIIPYAANTDTTDGNVSALGTSTWTFAAGHIDNLYYKDLKTITVVAGSTADNAIDKMAGSYFFSGSGLFGGINDWVGIQAGYGSDKFQLVANGVAGVLYRHNDTGGTNTTSWTEIKNLMTPEAVFGQNGITVTKKTNTFGTGDTALTYDAGVNIGHSNSVTEVTNYNKPYVKYDAQGHITGSSYWTATAAGTGGESGWIKVATIVHTANYDNTPIMLFVSQRGNTVTYKLHIVWKNVSNTDPNLDRFYLVSDESTSAEAYIIKSATSTWDLYIKKIDSYEAIAMHLYGGKYFGDHMRWTWTDVQTAASAITGGTEATKRVFYNSHSSRTANTVLAAPDGSDGVASFRKLVAADIPSLDYSKVSISRNLTSGTKVGTITIDGTATDLYCQTNTNTDTKVTQSASTAEQYRPLILGAKYSSTVSELSQTVTDQVYVTTKMYAQASTGKIYASEFITNTYPSDSGSSLSQYGLYLKSYKKASLPAGGDYSYSRAAVRVYDGKAGDSSGMLLEMCSGGLTIVGGGESASALAALVSDDQRDANTSRTRLNVGGTLNTAFHGSSEQLILSSDNNIYFLTYCNTIANRKPVVLDTNSYFYPGTTKTGSLGTSSYMWNSVYAATVYENGKSLGSKYGLNNQIYGLNLTSDEATFNGAETLITSLPSSSGTSEPSYQRVTLKNFIKKVTGDIKEPVLYNNTTNPTQSATVTFDTNLGTPKYLKLFISVVSSSSYSAGGVTNVVDIDPLQYENGCFVGHGSPGQYGVSTYLTYICILHSSPSTGQHTYNCLKSGSMALSAGNDPSAITASVYITKIIAVY